MAGVGSQQKKNDARNLSVSQLNETAKMLENMYKAIAENLKAVKRDILNEMKYTSMQTGALYESVEKVNDDTYAALKKEISAVCANFKALSDDMQSKIAALSENGCENAVTEVKYVFSQNQSIYEALSEEIAALKQSADEGVETLLGKVGETISVLEEKIDALHAPEIDFESLAETVKEKVVEALPYEETDYDRIAESVAEKTEVQVAAHSKEILDSIAAVPVAENVDYNRIVDEVSDKVLEKIGELLSVRDAEKEENKPVQEPFSVDYDRIAYGAAEKVVESLPPVERVDYRKIAEDCAINEETIEKVVSRIAEKIGSFEQEKIDYEKVADAVLARLPEQETIDYDRLAESVLAKLPEQEKIDYDRLAECILAKLPEPEKIDYDKLADVVLAKLPEGERVDYERIQEIAEKAIDYEVIADIVLAKLPAQEEVDYDRIACETAAKVDLPLPEEIDYNRLADAVAERIPEQKPAEYELLVDEVGVRDIAENVAARLEESVKALAEQNEPKVDVDALAEEIAAKTGAPVYETMLDENGAEMIADAVAKKLREENSVMTLPLVNEEYPVEQQEEPQEEPLEEAQDDAVEELAVAQDGEETEEYVVRFNRSFTAKIKQSDEEVKRRYGEIKNAFLSYKKVKSNVSWSGDRFNSGRSTIAKMAIRGKTLCVYFALDPNDPAFKPTVYNQRDVSDQKAHEKTPFMMRIKSDLGAKRAVRLVEAVVERFGDTTKKKDFEPVDYTRVYRYAGDKRLEETGLIKRSIGKKVAFDFD